MPTTPRGFPYPAATDPVAQGAAAIQDLAAFTSINCGISAAGKVHVAITGSVGQGVTVTFPAGRFPSAPRVTAVTNTSTIAVSLGGDPSTSSVFIWVRFMNGTSGTDSTDVQWIAHTDA